MLGHVKLCPQLSQRLVALERGEGHLRLEGSSVIASRSLHRLAPLVRHPSVANQRSEATTYHTVRMSWASSLPPLPRLLSLFHRPSIVRLGFNRKSMAFEQTARSNLGRLSGCPTFSIFAR
jgi:hypothetical protein